MNKIVEMQQRINQNVLHLDTLNIKGNMKRFM
jgi:hypothetical protein